MDFSLIVDGFSGNPNLDISEVEQLKVNLYPNPNNGIFNLELPVEEYNSLKIFTITGVLIYSKELNGESVVKIDISSIAKAGIYMVALQSGSKISTKKIIIK